MYSTPIHHKIIYWFIIILIMAFIIWMFIAWIDDSNKVSEM